MSIIIKGMDMPKSCEECRLYVDKWCYAIDVESFTEENGTKATFICPLVEIPTPHGEIIDRGRIKGIIDHGNGDYEIVYKGKLILEAEE